VAAARRLGHAAGPGTGGDALVVWAERTGRRQRTDRGHGLPRFAFYGRVSTEDQVTSLARQRADVPDLRMSTPVEVVEAIRRSASRREVEREDVLAPHDPAGVHDLNEDGALRPGSTLRSISLRTSS
jgi:hypothetical protein